MTFDISKAIPYLLALGAIAVAIAWFVMHDKAVAARAVAVDRAAANEVVIAKQQEAINAQQKIIDYADELSKVRHAQLQDALGRNRQFTADLAALNADPDVARVLATRVPEPVRQLRRAGTAPGGGDGVRLLRPAGVLGGDGDAALPGRDDAGPAQGKPGAARSAQVLQLRQGADQTAHQPPAANNAAGLQLRSKP